MVELADRWLLPLEGRAVVEVLLEHAVVLRFDDDAKLSIAAPFVLQRDGRTTTLDLEVDVDELVTRRPLTGAVVVKASAFKNGSLQLELADRQIVKVSATDEYEPWDFVGSDGLWVVSVPGGELSIWRAPGGEG